MAIFQVAVMPQTSLLLTLILAVVTYMAAGDCEE